MEMLINNDDDDEQTLIKWIQMVTHEGDFVIVMMITMDV